MLIDVNFEQSLIDECAERMKQDCSPEDYEKYAPKSVNDLCTKLNNGIYLTGLNFNLYFDIFSTDRIKDRWDSFSNEESDYKSNYGVCDNYQQVLDYYPELNDANKKFVLSLCEIRRDTQPECDGWRWEKWGEYIGIQNPQRDYIADEPDIESVYVYHIYEIE